MTPELRNNFDRLMNPRHIAFVGGNDAIIAIGEARRRGFTGQYWAVNAKRSDLAGLPCFSSIDSLPEAPDAVFLAVPARGVVEAVRKLAEMGAGGVVCYAAGFKEAGPEGAEAEAALLEVVGDLALIGPNCYGVINYLDNSALWPFAHGGDTPGYGAAIITQSGMFSSDITMSQRSVPLTHMISAGNQSVLGQADFIDLLCENPAVRAIGVHIEGLQDIPKFEQAALKALSQNTPIVALKTGSSEIGGTLTVSHTGSLSGANELYEALFERTGVIEVTNPAQLLETLKYLCIVGAPKGKRLTGFTCSGGGATMLADRGELIGLDFPTIPSNTSAKLLDLLPPIATVSNPLDYTTPIWGQPELTAPVFLAALEGTKGDAAILVQDYPAPTLDESKIYYQNDAKAFADGAAAVGTPAAICSTLPENIDKQTREYLISIGVAPMQGIHEALNAISAAADWEQARHRILSNPLDSLISPTPLQNVVLLDEAAGKEILSQTGISIPHGQCKNADYIVAAATEIGFPVVLKMMGPKLAHKTEAGAVMLNLKTASDVATAIIEMTQSVIRHDPDAVTERFLIERMAESPVAELIVGIRHDTQFGYAMTLGSGGILVELVGDACTLLLPTSPETIRRGLNELKVMKMLEGFRGRPTVDLDALCNTLYRLTESVLANAGRIAEIEVNPLFVYEKHCVAVDALVHLEDTDQRRSQS